MNTFSVNYKALKKAQTKIKYLRDLKTCLQAEVCPICGGDLRVKITSDRNREYYCDAINCSFTWGIQKKEKEE